MTCQLKTIISLFIILVFSSALASEEQPKNSVSVRGKKLKTIIVGEYYPYTFVNKEGLPDGFSVDLAKAVSQVMDHDLEITVDTWDNAQNDLKTGRIDFLPMMAYSRERDRDFDFSAPHTIAYDAFFIRKGIRPINSISELADKKVIVMNKDQAHDYLISTGLITSDRFILVDSLPEALRILSSDRGDVAIMPKLIGLLHIKRLSLTNIDSSPVVIDSYTRPFSFAVKEGDQALLEQLNQGLIIIKSTGQYKTIYLKWFGIVDPPGLPTKNVVIFGAVLVASFAIIAGVILLWTFTLKKKVALRTQHLKQEINDRELAEEALLKSEEKYRLIAENMADIISVTDMNMRFTYISPSIMRIRGFTVEEAMGQTLDQVMTPESWQITLAAFEEEMKLEVSGTADPDRIRIMELEEYKKDGSLIWLEVGLSFLRDKDSKPIAMLAVSRDINVRKQAEEALRKSEEIFAKTFQSNPACVGLSRLRDGLVIEANQAMLNLLGYSKDEFVGHTIPELGVWNDLTDRKRLLQTLTTEGRSVNREYWFRTRTGELLLCDHSAETIHMDNEPHIIFTFFDLTERKRAEEALKASEEKHRTLFESSRDAIMTLAPPYWTFTSGNPATVEMFETGGEAGFVALGPWELSPEFQPDGRLSSEKAAEMIQRAMTKGSHLFEWTHKRLGGESFPATVLLTRMEIGGQTLLEATVRDITESKRANEALERSEERYRSIFENAQEGIFQTTDEGRFLTANQAMAIMLGYDSPEDLMTTVINIPKQLYVNSEDRKVLLRIIEAQGLIRGFETQFYRKDGSIIWASVNMQSVRDTEGRLLYYEGFNEDITIKKEGVERIRKALGATVQAMAVTVETRDPYTAGHQRRVADLARSIATEMNLPADQIDGIRMAAIIHDLGKISVPAEILSKPTKLTALEFSLIKTHAQSGYDILKDIDFPWPIARMVLEHHERINGSGYPNGLISEEALLESQILAVADVVESMASHRPYRPALGIDAALKEIENNRGTLYDNAVADACMKLFREKGYQLP